MRGNGHVSGKLYTGDSTYSTLYMYAVWKLKDKEREELVNNFSTN